MSLVTGLCSEFENMRYYIENMRYLVWAKPGFIYMLLRYHCFFTHSVPVIFPKCKLNSAKNNPLKVVPYRPAQTERELQWFKMSFRISDNFTTNSYSLTPNKMEWSYRRTLSNKKTDKTLHHSSASTEQLER